MNILDKLIDRIADKVVEHIEVNTVKLDGEKLIEEICKRKYEEDSISRLFKGHTGRIEGYPIKINIDSIK